MDKMSVFLIPMQDRSQ